MIPVHMKWLLGSLFCITMTILSLIWTPYELALNERLRMRPGLPAFNWWYEAPNTTLIKLYFFNITNAERFLDGTDPKMELKELDPIVFQEVLTHSDPVFNDNGTLSYTFRKTHVYDESRNTVDLNTTIYFPNIPALMGLSIFWDSNYFLKKILNYALEKTNSKPIVKKTIYEILYNNTDILIRVANTLLPSVAVVDNAAIMPIFSHGYNQRVTVYIGTEFGHENFFHIEKYNGSIYLPKSGATCKDKITNTTHGIILNQLIEKTKNIRYYYDELCGIYELTYKDEVQNKGMNGYRFVMVKNLNDRIYPLENDCFKGYPTLPNGLKDLSSCWLSLPLVRSNPHFLYGDPKLLSYVNGMRPNANKHTTYGIIEPMSGIPLQFKAYVQVNLYMRPTRDFHEDFQKFTDMILPLLYFELDQDYVPNYVIALIRLGHFLPIIGYVISTLLFLLGLYCTCKLTKNMLKKNITRKKRKNTNTLAHEEEFFLETEKMVINK